MVDLFSGSLLVVDTADQGEHLDETAASKTLGLSVTNLMVIMPPDGDGQAGVRDCVPAGDVTPSRHDSVEVSPPDP